MRNTAEIPIDNVNKMGFWTKTLFSMIAGLSVGVFLPPALIVATLLVDAICHIFAGVHPMTSLAKYVCDGRDSCWVYDQQAWHAVGGCGGLLWSLVHSIAMGDLTRLLFGH